MAMSRGDLDGVSPTIYFALAGNVDHDRVSRPLDRPRQTSSSGEIIDDMLELLAKIGEGLFNHVDVTSSDMTHEWNHPSFFSELRHGLEI